MKPAKDNLFASGQIWNVFEYKISCETLKYCASGKIWNVFEYKIRGAYTKCNWFTFIIHKCHWYVSFQLTAQSESVLLLTSEEEQPEDRSQPPKVGSELFETRPFPEIIDLKQQMIV